MAGGSLLTQGLEPLLRRKSPAIHERLSELYELDDALQAAHVQAIRDSDLGEEVVTKYKAFLTCREQLVAELEKQKIPVPWQLRTTIDDLELTLKQRNASRSNETQDPTQSPPSMQVAVAFIGPTLVALAIATLWYHFNT
ncbi:unnamed protein product [Hyaloperonospora brassicae]|uniref:Uncharacterized protein n=1 Tax=Hyaloperonospora brassicae TaxID=162125 RepID=A0AAV0U148_HYABA|nr:unnamed protein product [Hyaloperonospora brassicae]